MDLGRICKMCLMNDDLINEFCRLKNIKWLDKRSLLEIEIAKACNYNAYQEFIAMFVKFIVHYIYLPIPTNCS